MSTTPTTSGEGSRPDAVPERRIGSRIQEVRQRRSISLRELAGATQLSPSFLSLVENDKSDISIGRLARIIDFLDMDLAAFFGGENPAAPGAPIVIRESETSRRVLADNGVSIKFLGQSRSGRLEYAIHTYEAGGVLDLNEYRLSRPGESMHYVLAGDLTFEFEDFAPIVAGKGDVATFFNPQLRLTRNMGPAVAVEFVVKSLGS